MGVKGSTFDDLDDIRAGDDDMAGEGLQDHITLVDCKKPPKQDFVRVHPDPSMSIEIVIIRDKANNRDYFVPKDLRQALSSETMVVRVCTAITWTGKELFLWAATVSPEGPTNPWHATMLDAQIVARDKWVRVSANCNAGRYDIQIPSRNIPDPKFPDMTLNEILEKAFGDRMIDSLDHEFIKQLRGA